MDKEKMASSAKISDNVIVGDNVVVGENVTIQPGCIIENNVVISDGTYIDYNVIIRENVKIGKNSYIGASCILGEYTMDVLKNSEKKNSILEIGEESLIRSGSIIYADTTIGTHFQTGHRVTIREKSIIGNYVSVGTLSDIQGFCEIGNYVRMHSNVHIGQESKIEDYVWIFPYVILTNDPTPPSYELEGVTLKSFSVIATGSVLLPGVTVEGDSLVAAGAVVTKDVKEGDVVGGNPAKVISHISQIKNHITGENVYPWRYTFKRGMPWEETDYQTWYESLMQETETK